MVIKDDEIKKIEETIKQMRRDLIDYLDNILEILDRLKGELENEDNK